MARILAIDYGRRRCGIAVTDPLRIAANGLDTVPTHQIEQFIADYCTANDVDLIIVGHPLSMDGSDSECMKYIAPFLARLRKRMPAMKIEEVDERFTSVLAHRAMIEGGMKKKERQVKGNADRIAAVIMLTDYLGARNQTTL